MKKGVLRNFEAWNFIKRETLAQVFSCKCCEISKNTFFTEHLQATASENRNQKTVFLSELEVLLFGHDKTIILVETGTLRKGCAQVLSSV